MNKNRFRNVAIGLLAGLSLIACGKEDQVTDQVSIGIVQYAEHEALSAAKEGFLETLQAAGYKENDNLTIHFQNAQGDQTNLQTMAEQLAGKHDLHFAIATPAAQALLVADGETPSLFTAVTDPVAAELVDSLEKPGGNMTGSVDAVDVKGQIEIFLRVLPEAKTVGIFYNSSEVNSEIQAKQAEAALKKAGKTVVVKTVTSTNDVQQVMTSLASQVDALYLPTDNTVAATAATIGDILKEKKIPAMGSDEAYLDAVLFTSGVDYHAIGQEAGKLAVEILEGKNPAELSVALPKKASLAVNEDMAKALGIDPVHITNQMENKGD